jgi:redox-sensitive bicupin YhaK (pirin superfamily)
MSPTSRPVARVVVPEPVIRALDYLDPFLLLDHFESATPSDYEAAAGPGGGRFLLAAARPLGEPVARYGPFVMNTRAEIEQTLEDLRTGRFIRAEPRDA